MGNVAPLVVVTGLKRETAVLDSTGLCTIAGGGASDRLAAELVRAVPGAGGVISFGMAGALDPTLRPGDWVIGESLAGADTVQCDARWVATLAHNLPGARIGAIWADGQLVATPEDKRVLHAQSGAIAVDMESHLAAAAAARAGLPFAVLRCISDAADAALPPAVAVAMRPGGGLALGAVLASVLARPSQLPVLARTLVRFARAYGALKAGSRALPPRLAFDQR